MVFLLLCQTGKYHLVFWEEENSVSVVSMSNIPEGVQPVVGKSCDIVLQRKLYSGIIAATGTVLLVVHSVAITVK